jgi:ferredoxin
MLEVGLARNIIFYFSGTGNSLKCALAISERLADSKLVNMGPQYTCHPDECYDRVGFVFPCYMGGLPHRVREFIATLDASILKDAYIYTVITSGGPGWLYGYLPAAVNDLLAAHDAQLSYYALLQAFSSYVVYYDMSPKVEEKNLLLEEQLAVVLDDVAEGCTRRVGRGFGLLKVMDRSGQSLAEWDREFVVNNNCISCGQCQRICPVANIQMAGGQPSWLHHCEQCLSCLQWCPKRAIDFDNKTQTRGRYHNPDISATHMISLLHDKPC